MLGMLFIKPEGIQNLDGIKEWNNTHLYSTDLEDIHLETQLRRRINEGVNALLNDTSSIISPSLVYVEKGILSKRFFDVLYPENLPQLNPIIIAAMVEKYVGYKYGMTFFDIPNDEKVHEILTRLKGRLSNISPEHTSGIRGFLLQRELRLNSRYHEKNPEAWLHTGNYIHTTDNKSETVGILSYVINKKLRGDDIFSTLSSDTKKVNIFLTINKKIDG